MNRYSIKGALLLSFSFFILAFWAWYSIANHDTSAPPTKPPLVDLIIQGLTLERYDVNGELIQRLQSANIEHRTASQEYHLIQPEVWTNKAIATNTSRDQSSNWTINAQHALVSKAWEKIVFYDDVIIIQKDGQEKLLSKLTTDKLDYFPKQQIASSSGLVHFQQPGVLTVQARGMKADFASSQLQLLSQAKASYKPPLGTGNSREHPKV